MPPPRPILSHSPQGPPVMGSGREEGGRCGGSPGIRDTPPPPYRKDRHMDMPPSIVTLPCLAGGAVGHRSPHVGRSPLTPRRGGKG